MIPLRVRKRAPPPPILPRLALLRTSIRAGGLLIPRLPRPGYARWHGPASYEDAAEYDEAGDVGDEVEDRDFAEHVGDFTCCFAPAAGAAGGAQGEQLEDRGAGGVVQGVDLGVGGFGEFG
ncbi:hypothetical protein V502_09984 [Pseudogymnoascus sp. VKM F-4520 (FW-2644)]|nr:hypothetical protein V502_09984 [Pseudogymnoascus sp. VKM F-4520 (FW-2644)]